MKVCSICLTEKELDNYYSRDKVKSNGDRYIYYFPYCIDCAKEKSTKWAEENPEKRKAVKKRYDDKPEEKIRLYKSNRKRLENGKYREWHRNNKDRVRKYRIYRESNKTHEISKEEWEACKEYFNNECAYCGISNQEAKIVYKNYLHKDHANHQGANDLSNCIPACKSCNGSKYTSDLVVWYTDKLCFSQERLSKIQKWLESDYMFYIQE